MDEIEKGAEAVGEIAKFGSQALATGEKLGGFRDRVFGGLITDAAGLIGDRVKFYRWERQLRLGDEADKILRDRGVTDTKPVPPKVAIPLIEAATLEDKDELQDRWARLLANAMDPGFSGDVRVTLVEILRSLTTTDVRVLETIYNTLKQKGVTSAQLAAWRTPKQSLTAVLGLTEEQYYLSIYNLFRVQCLAPAVIVGGVRMGSEPLTIFKGAEEVCLTVLGWSLVDACRA